MFMKNFKQYLNIMLLDESIKGNGDWGLGIGNWGLGIGDWAQSPIPNPPIPNPQSPIPNPQSNLIIIVYVYSIYIY